MTKQSKTCIGGSYYPDQLPEYTPEFWSDPFIRSRNNCYAYAFNDPYHLEWDQNLAPGVKQGYDLMQRLEADPSNGLYYFIEALELDGCLYIEGQNIDVLDGYYPIHLRYNVAYGDPGYHFYRLDYDAQTDTVGWSHKNGDGLPSRLGFDFTGNKVDIMNPSMIDQGEFDIGGAYFYVPYPGLQAGPDHLRLTAQELMTELTCETTDLALVPDPSFHL